MRRPVVLLLAAVLVACSADHPTTPVAASRAPTASPSPNDRTRCEERVDARGHVRARDITPAMLTGTTVAAGSWHLQASRSITSSWCRGHGRAGWATSK